MLAQESGAEPTGFGRKRNVQRSSPNSYIGRNALENRVADANFG